MDKISPIHNNTNTKLLPGIRTDTNTRIQPKRAQSNPFLLKEIKTVLSDTTTRNKSIASNAQASGSSNQYNSLTSRNYKSSLAMPKIHTNNNDKANSNRELEKLYTLSLDSPPCYENNLMLNVNSKSLSKVNKHLVNDFIFKDKAVIKYSKRNSMMVMNFLEEKEFKNKNKVEEIAKMFDENKKYQCNNKCQVHKNSIDKTPRKLSRNLFNSSTKMKQKKSQVFARRMLVACGKDAFVTVNRQKNFEPFETVNYEYLKKQIKLHNIISKTKSNEDAFDSDMEDISIKAEEEFIKYPTKKINKKTYIPKFALKGIKTITMKKFNAIDGKYFGIPV